MRIEKCIMLCRRKCLKPLTNHPPISDKMDLSFFLDTPPTPSNHNIINNNNREWNRWPWFLFYFYSVRVHSAPTKHCSLWRAIITVIKMYTMAAMSTPVHSSSIFKELKNGSRRHYLKKKKKKCRVRDASEKHHRAMVKAAG